MTETATLRTAVILTALGVETSAVLRRLKNVSTESISGTGFFRGRFEDWDIAVAEVGPGNVGAAVIATRACDHYRPQVALFVGIAGGIKDVAIGDVVVATKVYGYESAKDEADDFRPRPNLLVSAHALTQRARLIRQVEDWRAQLDPGIGHANPSICVEPIADGEKVVASTKALTAQFLKKQYSDAVAVEMEGRGFLKGVHVNHPVQGCVIRGISDLLSGKAEADEGGSQPRAADAAAAVAFQLLVGFEDNPTGPLNSEGRSSSIKAASLDISDLKRIAGALLEAGTPPSIGMLFPAAPALARAAIESSSAAERTLTGTNSPDNASVRTTIAMLVGMEERRHLILGPPGSGKTHALWHAANQLLQAGDTIPLFLPAGQANRWDELASMVSEAAQTFAVDDVLRDPRVCVMIDGWSEFAGRENASEKQRALRALKNARTIANGKVSDVSDTLFKPWSLELLSTQKVIETLSSAQPGAAPLPSPVIDLLRLPLLLSIHVLSNATASGTGDLLRQFHDHLARDLPEPFTMALAEAAAALELRGDRAYGRLISEFQTRASNKGIAGPVRLLRKLGTIGERNGRVLPIHDLYWSWLCGRGLLADRLTQAAISRLETRESYRLALQSGAHPRQEDIGAAANDDLILASELDASLRSLDPDTVLAVSINSRLSDSRLAVRNRGGLAALVSAKSLYLKSALETLSALTVAKLYIPDWSLALRPEILFQQRAILSDWIGSEGTDFILDAISERGEPEWVPWLQQMASAGKIEPARALAVALGCAAGIPPWAHPHLDDLFRDMPWKLRAATARKSNLDLGRYVATNYERLVTTIVPLNSSGWIDVNCVLVSCADDSALQRLRDQFGAMNKHAQERLGFAVVERGQPWVAEFQRIAFASPNTGHHHQLKEILSPEINDATARAWIAAGSYEEGWRVLIARHGESVLPELIAGLPTSFAGLHDIPPLAVMRFLEKAPATLVDELWGRLGSPMQPKAMQDVLNAIAKVYPTGVPSIVRFITQVPDALPAYHLAQTLRLYETWRERMGAQLMIQLPTGESLPFPSWIGTYSALHRWEDHFTPQMLSLVPDRAIEIVLNHLKRDIEKSAAVLVGLRELRAYNADLLDYMLPVPALAKLIPNVFASAFETFPVAQMHRCIASPDIDQEQLLFRLGSTSNPLHRTVHAELIERVLSEPFNLQHIRYVANMLRGHTVEDTDTLLRNAPGTGDDGWIWLVREVETARSERLINENGELRHQ